MENLNYSSFFDCPNEIQFLILSQSDIPTYGIASQVCTIWNKILGSEIFWKEKCQKTGIKTSPLDGNWKLHYTNTQKKDFSKWKESEIEEWINNMCFQIRIERLSLCQGKTEFHVNINSCEKFLKEMEKLNISPFMTVQELDKKIFSFTLGELDHLQTLIKQKKSSTQTNNNLLPNALGTALFLNTLKI